MRTWLAVLVAVVAAAAVTGALASPVDGPDSAPTSTGSKTLAALKEWLRPVTSYFSRLPTKTPSDVATDVKEKVTDMKEWMQENEAVQGLMSSLTPVRSWLKDKANVLGDKTFKEMYEDVKTKVAGLDETIGTWMQKRQSK